MVGKWKRWSEPLDSTEHPLHAWPLHHTVWPNVKNPPKIRLKNSWNWQFIVMPATVWRILNVLQMQLPETENVVNLLKLVLKKLVKSRQENLFLAGFRRLEPLCISLRPETTAAAFAAIYRMMSRSLASVTDKSWNLKQPQRIQCRQINTNQV